ncbi:hypothetical protein LV89_01982 [Arcicella aurantiaca]|uniref:Uncharacterized protein n=2 Tax=Arcicella aurantiaca TaxID=591202 RepID=A0A316E9V1_9BACT|nr:hypothetical protein LV89_01982 [Arcicella aurantiaca]
MKVRCSKLDSAAVLIEKGKNCEYQLDLYKQMQGHYQNLTRLYESDNLMYVDTLFKLRVKLYDYEGLIRYQKKKIKHKNQKLGGSVAFNILLLLLLL